LEQNDIRLSYNRNAKKRYITYGNAIKERT
jgi:hypothetical protein